jgi:hypothetical protein
VIARGGGKEAWRWRATADYVKHHTIMVLEPHPDAEAERKQDRAGKPTVPFGFGRVLRDSAQTSSQPVADPVAVEPLLWEGDGA